MNAAFPHRSCYVNFGEHLQNRWNPNLYYRNAPNQWTDTDWLRFLEMIRNFGYNVFEFWLPPTLFSPAGSAGSPAAQLFIERMRRVFDLAHQLGLKVKFLCAVNTIGADWYYACPNEPEDKAMIWKLWRYWNHVFFDADIVGIFPGDPGGCNRNGCTHETFVELALALAEETLCINPGAWLEVNTWGTPFTGWGGDMRFVPGWDGSYKMLSDESLATPETPFFIWNGDQTRAQRAMEYFIGHLPSFPENTMVGINLGFSPDGDAELGGDARGYAREIAKIRPIVSWDYSVSEGELINYPHWRLPRMSARRREEAAASPYTGGMVYTMAPKLNLLTLYAGAQFLLNPDISADDVSRRFCTQVFGAEHWVIGELFEAFEVVKGWGHYPRRMWSKPALRKVYAELIDRLEAADPAACTLPVFPDADEYRRDLLWFARVFLQMAGDGADRQAIGRQYREYALAIYDFIPQSADERTASAQRGFANILAQS